MFAYRETHLIIMYFLIPFVFFPTIRALFADIESDFEVRKLSHTDSLLSSQLNGVAKE